LAELTTFLARAARTPFAWGGLNCLSFPADWVREVRGLDLAEGFRGRVHTAIGAARFLRRRGGLLAFASERAAACGLEPASFAICGDVGVVEALGVTGKRVLAGAICTGRRWAMLTEDGFRSAEMAPLAAWRV
jgi:hypothetical protein